VFGLVLQNGTWTHGWVGGKGGCTLEGFNRFALSVRVCVGTEPTQILEKRKQDEQETGTGTLGAAAQLNSAPCHRSIRFELN